MSTWWRCSRWLQQGFFFGIVAPCRVGALQSRPCCRSDWSGWWRRICLILSWGVSFLPIPTISMRWSMWCSLILHSLSRQATCSWCWSQGQHFHTRWLPDRFCCSDDRWFQGSIRNRLCYHRHLSDWLLEFQVDRRTTHPGQLQDSCFCLCIRYFHIHQTIRDCLDQVGWRGHRHSLSNCCICSLWACGFLSYHGQCHGAWRQHWKRILKAQPPNRLGWSSRMWHWWGRP